MKKALITGITGQDGSYLADFLLERDYKVHGLIRRTSNLNNCRITHLINNPQVKERFFLHYGDMTDVSSLQRIVGEIEPDEVYNLAAMSDVRTSFDIPVNTGEIDAIGAIKILDILRTKVYPTKFYQASTSELFGKVREIPQTELTPFHPRSPYAVAKLYAYWAVINYRETYHMHACNGILFNHESPRRGENFVSKKITLAAAKIKYGLQDRLLLGNIDAKRDWGYAKDYVEGMWLMLQYPKPEDFVLATGVSTTIRKFVELAFTYIDCELEWIGAGTSEKGVDKKTGKILVEIDPVLFRPSEVDILLGNAAKAKEKLGWKPRVALEQLVEIMMKFDLEYIKQHLSKPQNLCLHFK